MVRIRLRRMGAKKKPFYRIVVANQRNARDGRFIEIIGTYDPLTEPSTVELNKERAAYWVGVGGQPSEAVARLLKREGIVDDAGKVIYQPAEAPAAEAETPVAEIAAPAQPEAEPTPAAA